MPQDESTTERPPSGSDHPPARPTEMNAADLRGGDRVAHYKILEPLGEGGFAVVYLAEQTEPVRRRVALKIIKLGMDTKQVIARFEAERQALAMMDHPNVAKVFDAGVSETGRPYFVMEYVPGEPITNYCDRHRLTTRERLELLMQACEAVQHAHQKGIIHRDLKPSNVLVAVKDGNPQVKVIDFGVAKAISQRLTEKTIYTEQGQLIGTPEYMSPEQAEMGELDIDTRSDIYSLGVLLYELLTGALPFDPTTLRKAAFGEIQRIIREVEPPKPSTRLSSLGDESTSYAQKRRADPRSLLRELRGDLDWITMKALEKDRTRRYATASELARDLARHLSGDAIEAAPPSARYRISRFVRKHRVSLNTTILIGIGWVLLTVVLGLASFLEMFFDVGDVLWLLAPLVVLGVPLILVVLSVFMWRIDRGRFSLINAILGGVLVAAFGGLIFIMRIGEPGEVPGLDVLDATSKKIEGEFGDEPLVEASIRMTLGNFYWRFDWRSAEQHLQEALRLRRDTLGEEHVDTLTSMHNLARLYERMRRWDEAERLYSQTLELRRRVLGEEHADTLTSMNDLAALYLYLGRSEEGERLLVKSLRIQLQTQRAATGRASRR